MKHSFQSTRFLIVALPFWAVTLTCTAQNLTPATAPPPQSTVALPQDLHAAGTVSAYDARGLTVQEPSTGSMTVYMTNGDTTFVDTHGRFVAPDRVALQTPVNVHYTPVGNMLLATKIVVNAQLTADGNLTELSPGAVAIQLAGLPSTRVSYASGSKLKFVDKTGAVLPLQAVPMGAPVRVFYTKEDNALVASKVQLLDPNTGLSTTTTRTTTTTTTTQSNQR